MDILVLVLYVLACFPALRALNRRRGAGGVPSGVRVSIVLVLLLAAAQTALGVYSNVLWFREVGAEHRFWTEIGARWMSFAIGTVIAFVLLWGNAFLVRRVGGKRPRLAAVQERERSTPGGPGI